MTAASEPRVVEWPTGYWDRVKLKSVKPGILLAPEGWEREYLRGETDEKPWAEVTGHPIELGLQNIATGRRRKETRVPIMTAEGEGATFIGEPTETVRIRVVPKPSPYKAGMVLESKHQDEPGRQIKLVEMAHPAEAKKWRAVNVANPKRPETVGKNTILSESTLASKWRIGPQENEEASERG